MRNVNIVYNKGRRQSFGQLPHTSHNALTGPRRSVDEYYHRLIEKGKNRESTHELKKELIERAKLRTANNHRKNDKYNILNTLNIASVPIHLAPSPQQPLQERREAKTLTKFISSKKMSLSRPVLAGLHHSIPLDNLFTQEASQNNISYNKLKCLYKQKNGENKGTVLAVSVNFILNEKYFWAEETVEETASKYWKILENYSNIAWICQKEQTCKKLLKYCKSNNLRLDAVYLIVPKRNRKLLTVGYGPIQNDFGIRNLQTNTPLMTKDEKKLIVINGLLIQDTSNLTYTSFYNMIPVLKNNRSAVYYTKIDLNDNNRFGLVVKMLSQSKMPKYYNLMPILDSYELKTQTDYDCTCDINAFQSTEVDLLENLETLKSNLIKFYQRSLSMKLNDKIVGEKGENSVQFIIGDTIRRNYKIFKSYQEFTQDYQEYDLHRKTHQNQGKKRKEIRRLSPSRYRNMVYLWEL